MHLLTDNPRVLDEYRSVWYDYTLPRLIHCALEAYEHIDRTWVPGSFLLCPWWIWKEGEDNVLRFNLIGLVMHSQGWTPDPALSIQHVLTNPANERNMSRHHDKSGAWGTTYLGNAMGINIGRRASDFIDAIDAVRRGDYETAVEKYSKGCRYTPHMGKPRSRRHYRLSDESARSPKALIRRLEEFVSAWY